MKMKIYEVRSEINTCVDSDEPYSTVDTELFLSKDKAIVYMREQALEYAKELARYRYTTYHTVDSYPNDAESIELNCCDDSDEYGLFNVTEREVNE